jgi:dihydroorotate dehydrogenase (NAD+) catalytic subunit
LIEFCGLRLAHPVVNGSGTFDAIAARRVFGDALLEHFPFSAFVSKTITRMPRAGNPPPRLWEAQAGMINSIGLPNRGLDGYVEHDLPQLAQLPVPLITNVMGATEDEVATLPVPRSRRSSSTYRVRTSGRASTSAPIPARWHRSCAGSGR